MKLLNTMFFPAYKYTSKWLLKINLNEFISWLTEAAFAVPRMRATEIKTPSIGIIIRQLLQVWLWREFCRFYKLARSYLSFKVRQSRILKVHSLGINVLTGQHVLNSHGIFVWSLLIVFVISTSHIFPLQRHIYEC